MRRVLHNYTDYAVGGGGGGGGGGKGGGQEGGRVHAKREKI